MAITTETVAVTTAPAFTVPAVALKRALAAIKPALPRRGGALGVLYSIRADIGDGTVTLTATNLDVTVSVPVADVGFHTAGASFLIPFAPLADLLKKVAAKNADTATLSADTENGTVAVSVGRITSSLSQTIPLAEWPRTPELESDGSVMLDMAVLADVASAMSPDDYRPTLASVGLIGADVVATDSYRLHLVRGHVDVGMEKDTRTGKDEPASILIPSSAVKIMVRQKGTALVSWDRSTVVAEYPGMTVRARRVDGEFPNYRQLIRGPGWTDKDGGKLEHPVRFDRAELTATVAELGALVTRDSAVPVRFRCARSAAILSVTVQDVGETSVELECSTAEALLAGGDFTVAFNPAYLLDAIGGNVDDTRTSVQLDVVDALKPLQISEYDCTTGETRLRLVMPVRVT